MKFNGRKYSHKQLVKNIVSVYDVTSKHDRYCWYSEANEYAIKLSKLSGLSIAQCCGILAAFSPLKSWSENKRIANAFLTHGIVDGLHTRLFTGKAETIAHYNKNDGDEIQFILDTLKGVKIQSFFLNILNPNCPNNVTIDRHAFSIALGRKLKDSETKLSKSQYELIKLAYIEAANILNISPVLLQSSTWLIWRRKGQLQLF